ncbi:hypothetical protein [Sphingomonas turrisvirgatae]|uniref:Uncharacterized protein n=1 Tax=Sphingomonas turrisvirgatae TaxID=1888892 RepID=A0A1E3M0B8_9SPHN|nr:hypothetical protein [Sphingomonas turrisvirgatae]ODP39454.1 hypothetical protein BFL28_10300 [Sphingomonas turrisvirgatae]
MNYKGLSFGLGIFSIALGAVEIIANRRIAQAMDQDDDAARTTLKAFGVREIAAGANLIAAPAHSTNMWNRVAGDGIDMAALGIAVTRAPRNPAVWGAIAFVAAAATVDILTARGLDRETGKASPKRAGEGDAAARQHERAGYSSIEPQGLTRAAAPAVA